MHVYTHIHTLYIYIRYKYIRYILYQDIYCIYCIASVVMGA